MMYEAPERILGKSFMHKAKRRVSMLSSCGTKAGVFCQDVIDPSSLMTVVTRQYPQIIILDNIILENISSNDNILKCIILERYYPPLYYPRTKLFSTTLSSTTLSSTTLSSTTLSSIYKICIIFIDYVYQ